MLVRTPDFLTEADRLAAVASLIKRGRPREVQEVNLDSIDEGLCVQMLTWGHTIANQKRSR